MISCTSQLWECAVRMISKIRMEEEMARTLVIYYSRRGQNYVGGKIKELEKGNTELLAEYIRDAVGADLFEVRTVSDYPEDYMACTELAKEELRLGVRPVLRNYIKDISAYDNIVVAGPCWWGTYPSAVFSQLEELDFRGKKVFPVMTHEGSGEARSRKDLKNICEGAKVERALAVQGSLAPSARDEVMRWAEKNLK